LSVGNGDSAPGFFPHFEAVWSVSVVRAFRGGFSGAFRVKGQRVFGVQALFISLVFWVGFVLDLLQIFQAAHAGRGNRSSFLKRVLPKQCGFFRPVLENGCRS